MSGLLAGFVATALVAGLFVGFGSDFLAGFLPLPFVDFAAGFLAAFLAVRFFTIVPSPRFQMDGLALTFVTLAQVHSVHRPEHRAIRIQLREQR
jgi:hypothetical protein